MARDPVRDIVRGLTSLEMTIVNISQLPWLAHSPYIGQITYADTIFPCFAFLSGMSPTPTRRNVGLIGIGVSLHTVAAFVKERQLRIPGVLQRLGLASIFANEPRLSFLQEFDGLPLIVLWYAISLLFAKSTNPLAHPDYPAASKLDTAQTRIDKFLFGTHLHTPTYDPEGALGALTTAVSMIVGKIFAQQRFSTSQHAVGALGMITLGNALHYLVPKYAPISKSMWTPSYVLVTSGVSILKYIAIEALTPYLPNIVQSTLISVGKRSLEIYVLSQLLTIAVTYGGEKSIWSQVRALIEAWTGVAGSDFVVSASIAGLMAASARLLVKHQLRLQI